MSRFLPAVACLLLAPIAAAQERIADFDNSLRVEYQFIHTGLYESSIGPIDIGETDTHVALLSGVYSLGERWKIYGSLPYVQKRHTGNPLGVHDPVANFVNFTPPDLRNVDDGDYHGGLQDFYGGVQYLAMDTPFFSLSPFISFGLPVSDYPFYASAAIGKNLWAIPVGASMDFTPYFSDWYFQADIAYVFSERVIGVDLNHWLAYVSASYYLTPRFAPRIFLSARFAPNALEFPEDFPDPDTENQWRHDQTLKHEFVNAGIGFDYILTERYELSATYYQTIDPHQVSEVDYAFTVALTWSY